MAYKIYLYDNETDCIGSGSLSSAYIQWQLEAAAGQDVEVHISSAGGSAFDSIAIYDLLKKYPGKVTTHIDALAASAASIVAMGGSTVCMSKYALLMIHKPMVGSGGNSDELLKDVQMLNVVQTRLAQIYMDKTGLDSVNINSLINAVTWLTAEQALDLGFIDVIEDYEVQVTNSHHIRNYTEAAPALYQKVINKILLPEKNETMNVENKELIEKTNGVLDKIMNFFKKIAANKLVTNTAEIYLQPGATLAEGTEVFNDVELSTPASDGILIYNKKKITIESGKVKNIVDDEDSEDDDNKEDKEDVENKAILNDLGINVQNIAKADIKNVAGKYAEIKNQLNAQNALLVEAKAALKEANDKLEKTREEVKNEVKSEFEPEGSKRSTKIQKVQNVEKDGMPTQVVTSASFVDPQGDIAKNVLKRAISEAKI
jgi:ATP-dependent Clp protease protease subunit